MEDAIRLARTRIIAGVTVGLVSIVAIVLLVWWLSNRNPAIKPPVQKSIPADMVRVAGKPFMMGSSTGDQYERPSHYVPLTPFFIDIYEVANRDYEKFVRATGYGSPLGWNKGYPQDAPMKPVTGVSWSDAVAYCGWRHAAEEGSKRLPTEAEWEFAARGPDELPYPWGPDWKQANANTKGSLGHLADVTAFKEGVSPTGAFNMVGNAWEWTTGDFVPYPGATWTQPIPSGQKVVRGGDYKSTKEAATTTYRLGLPPVGDPSNYESTGFRCAMDVPASSGTTAKR
jgi:formylglycine-generating enzyme required for sulfatase activity